MIYDQIPSVQHLYYLNDAVVIIVDIHLSPKTINLREFSAKNLLARAGSSICLSTIPSISNRRLWITLFEVGLLADWPAVAQSGRYNKGWCR